MERARDRRVHGRGDERLRRARRLERLERVQRDGERAERLAGAPLDGNHRASDVDELSNRSSDMELDVDGLVREHSPIEENLGQAAHGIGKEYVHKGNAAWWNVGSGQRDTRTPRMDESPDASQHNPKGSALPGVLLQR